MLGDYDLDSVADVPNQTKTIHQWFLQIHLIVHPHCAFLLSSFEKYIFSLDVTGNLATFNSCLRAHQLFLACGGIFNTTPMDELDITFHSKSHVEDLIRLARTSQSQLPIEFLVTLLSSQTSFFHLYTE